MTPEIVVFGDFQEICVAVLDIDPLWTAAGLSARFEFHHSGIINFYRLCFVFHVMVNHKQYQSNLCQQEGNCCQANGGANCCLNGEGNTNESEQVSSSYSLFLSFFPALYLCSNKFYLFLHFYSNYLVLFHQLVSKNPLFTPHYLGKATTI